MITMRSITNIKLREGTTSIFPEFTPVSLSKLANDPEDANDSRCRLMVEEVRHNWMRPKRN
jgi:hypothetical protein